MTEQYYIRLAEPKDFEVCLAFDCTETTEARTDEEKAALIRAKIGLKYIWVASTPEGHAIGSLSIDVLRPMMLPLLSWMYVSPGWRDQNVAHELFVVCKKDLKERNYKRILVSNQTDREQMLEQLRMQGMREIGTLSANPNSNIGEMFFMQEL